VKGNEAVVANNFCRTALRCCLLNANAHMQKQMDSSFRWNDGNVGSHQWFSRALQAWIPAFAGMTSER
jgi:hypothetical protein